MQEFTRRALGKVGKSVLCRTLLFDANELLPPMPVSFAEQWRRVMSTCQKESNEEEVQV